jgi:hypothetical protein
MMKKISHAALLILFLVSCFTRINSQPNRPSPSQSELIPDWIGLHLQLIRNTKGVAHPAYARHFAYSGVALYEALVPGFKEYKSIKNRLSGSLILPAAAGKKELFYPAVANAVLAQMMRYFYSANPNNVKSIDSLEHLYMEYFSTVVKDPGELRVASDWAKSMAGAVFEWSKLDGVAEASTPYTPRGAGYWEPTPPSFASALLPGLGNCRTVLKNSIEAIVAPAPIPFSAENGSAFYNSAKEVYDVSLTLSEEQKAIAFFWDDAPNGTYVSAFGHWFNILRQILQKEKLSLEKSVEAYLRLGITMNEATLSCWKSKYQYEVIRPVSYIRKYMDQSNWKPLIGTPPHPEYPAAHATLSSAAAYAMESVFGKNYAFTDHTYEDINMNPRSFNSFDEAGMEAGISRLYGGIHYRPSIEAGNHQGKLVGEKVRALLELKKR